MTYLCSHCEATWGHKTPDTRRDIKEVLKLIQSSVKTFVVGKMRMKTQPSKARNSKRDEAMNKLEGNCIL